jgi:hypothetical protein
MIYVHIVRMEAYNILDYAPFKKKESPDEDNEEFQDNEDLDDDDDDDDDDGDDSDDEDDQDGEDNEELLQTILSKGITGLMYCISQPITHILFSRPVSSCTT